VQVHYFLRRDRFWSGVLSEAESQLVAENLARDGVQVHQRTELTRILGAQGRVTGVETADGTRIPCEIVAVAIGVRPQIEVARDSGLGCERGILVDEYLRSSDARIFAAGDVAEVRDPKSGRGKLNVLWNTAVEKGHVAGHNMAADALGDGRLEPLHAHQSANPLNITRLAGLHTTIIGAVGKGEDADLQSLSRGDSQSWSELTDATVVEAGDEDEHVRLTLGGGVIAGAVVMGDQTLSFPLQDLIERRVDVSHIQSELAAPSAPLAELVHGAWHKAGGDHGQA
jgi:NAD(P)H-nitrite reductase large subunit